MREFKFRVWNKITERMMNQEDLEKTVKTLCKNDFVTGMIIPQNKDAVVMQYTGLKDKNGIEIFRGDILSYKHITYTDCSCEEIESIDDEVLIGIVTYRPLVSVIKPYSKNVRMFGYDFENKEGYILNLKSEELEIIGNIYENKELLEN